MTSYIHVPQFQPLETSLYFNYFQVSFKQVHKHHFIYLFLFLFYMLTNLFAIYDMIVRYFL